MGDAGFISSNISRRLRRRLPPPPATTTPAPPATTCRYGYLPALLRLLPLFLLVAYEDTGSPKAYLNPIKPSFLGFLIMMSLYKSLKR